WRVARVGEGGVGGGGGAGGREKLVLLVVEPAGIREFVVPSSGVAIVGRSASAQIFIDDPSVSRQHAELSAGERSLRLRDLGSRNGTRVGDVVIGGEGVEIR